MVEADQHADDVRLQREVKQYLWEHIHMANEGMCDLWAEKIVALMRRHSDDDAYTVFDAPPELRWAEPDG